MLQPNVLSVLQQSVPILSEKGESIVRCFYRILFERYPELKHVFNLSNQRNGNQAKALTDALFAYASLADQPEQLIPAVQHIAQKHVSLNIQPAQYAMVGEALLVALSEKLGLSMEHDIIQAWGEAYEVLAGVFIAEEQRLYQANAEKAGGWQGFRKFVIAKVAVETPLIKSFYLQPTDGKALATFQAGQYVSVKLTGLPDHPYDEIRQYSLSDLPGLPYYRISVKAEPGNPQGIVSNYLHAQLQPGDEVELSAPAGDFVLPEKLEREVVLIGAGVGITPMMGMLKSALQAKTQQSITLIHCAKNSQQHAFLAELDLLQRQQSFQHYRVYSEPAESDRCDHQGRLNQAALDQLLSGTEADVYFCGPFPFMVVLKQLLLERGFADERIHYEMFGPSIALAA
jgi:nitric oxide dioxygenase